MKKDWKELRMPYPRARKELEHFDELKEMDREQLLEKCKSYRHSLVRYRRGRIESVARIRWLTRRLKLALKKIKYYEDKDNELGTSYRDVLDKLVDGVD